MATYIKYIFLIIALTFSTSSAFASETTFSRDKTMKFFVSSSPNECAPHTLVDTKLSAEECAIHKKKIQKECEEIVVENMPEILSSDQMSKLMMRFSTCNAFRIGGHEYSNENSDKAHQKYKDSLKE